MRTGKFLLLALCGGIATPALPCMAATPAFVIQEDDPKAELEKRKAEVDETDPEAMFALALWADSQGLKTDSKRLLRKVIKLDKNHKEARTLLGYVWYEERWVTKREKERLERKKEEEEMLAKGLRKWRGEWVPLEDYEMYEKGLVPHEVDGVRKWMTPLDKERLEKGMFLSDKGIWITPEEKEYLDKGLFKVGEEWVSKEKADEAHSDSSNPWEFERDLIRLRTTCSYDFSQQSMIHADASVEEVYEILGVNLPDDFVKIDMIAVKEVADYQQLGQGVQDNNDALMSSVYETFCNQDQNTGRFTGVAKYTVVDEANPANNDSLSRLMVRHCAAETALRNFGFNDQIPRWFQTGVGTYCSRYWDPFQPDGVKKLGAWSVAALHREGGLIKLKSFFDSFTVSRQTILQTGLIISFLRHGTLPKKLAKQWEAVQAAIKVGEPEELGKAFVKLEIQLASKQADEAFEKYAESLLTS